MVSEGVGGALHKRARGAGLPDAGVRGSVYYQDKLQTLQRIFGVKDIAVEHDILRVGQRRFPIIHDVIVLSDPGRATERVKARLGLQAEKRTPASQGPDEAVQFSFGAEWTEYSDLLPEHQKEFAQYFDLVDLSKLRHARVCDLGCGIGRWSYFLKDLCQEIILVDFSDAIFVARQNLSGANHCLFFMGDLQALPFQPDYCDFLFCLGVLHHLPTPCLEAVRRLRQCAPLILVFVYYALDNRPRYFRWLLGAVTVARRGLCRIRQPRFRKWFSRAGALLIYKPLVYIGQMLRMLNLGHLVPLSEFYRNKSLRRIEQDVYDRFFTSIEQRVSREDILGLRDSFADVVVSDRLPYWHFLCVR